MAKNRIWYIIGGIVLLIIVLVSFNQCNRDEYNKLKGEYSLLRQEYDGKKQIIAGMEKERLREKDSLSKIIKDRDVVNLAIREENKKLRDRIAAINDRPIKIPQTVLALVEYFNDRFSTTENVVLENKVGLAQNTAGKVVYELEIKDNQDKIIILKDKEIENNGKEIANLTDNYNDQRSLTETAEREIEERKKLEELGDKNIKNLGDQVKTLKKRSTIFKILVPAAAALGFILGTQL